MQYLSVSSPNMGKCGPEKLRIWTLFSQCEFVKKIGDKEHWSNIPIKTATKIPHNKPNLVIWDKANKLWSAVEFGCLADIKITQNVNDKISVYGLLIRHIISVRPWF